MLPLTVRTYFIIILVQVTTQFLIFLYTQVSTT